MKRVIKCFSIVILGVMLAFLLQSQSTRALYDASKNIINVSVSKNSVKVNVRYQKGISKETAKYYWCPIENGSADIPNDPSDCNGDVKEVNYIDISEYSELDFISKSPADTADSKLTSYTFTVNKEDDPILNDLASLIEKGSNRYVLFAEVSFCGRREVYADGTIGSCAYYDDAKYVRTEVSLTHLTDSHFNDFAQDIEDEGIKTTMQLIEDIVMNTVLPIIWAVLGLFLVVKGALLGVQIVKSADEPQVRQEKIGSLKWLVIGVAIAFLSTGVVAVVMSFFGDMAGGK